MSTHYYPLFREYSLAIQNWLRDLIDLPHLIKYDFEIESITTRGTTVVETYSNDGAPVTTPGVNQHEVVLTTTEHGLKAQQAIKLYDTLYNGRNDNYFMIEAVKDNIIILNKEYKKLRSAQPIPGGRMRRVVNVFYAEMQDAVARIAQPLRNGLIQTPGVAFYLSDYQVKEGVRPKENYYTRRYYNNEGEKIGSSAVPPLQEYQLTYSINIWTAYRSHMSMLQYQVQSEFAPEKYFWVGDEEYGFEFTLGGDNCRIDREHHGQWAHALMEGIADASDLEPGSNVQRTMRTEINFTITTAYMPLPFDREQAYIGEIDLEQNIEDRLSRI